MKPPQKPSNVGTAFQEGGNIVSLAGLFALSAATLNPLPLLVGLIAEAVYLLFVPDSKWYKDRLETKYDKEVADRRAKLKERVFPHLSNGEISRFNRLEKQRGTISPTDGDKPYYRDVLRKLDYLLEKFLLFAEKRHEFHSYIESILEEVRSAEPVFEIESGVKSGKKKRVKIGESPVIDDSQRSDYWVLGAVEEIQGSYAEDIEQLHARLSIEQNLHNKALFDKRIEIVGRRSQYVSRIGEILSNLSHQMQLMEDTFGLISDEIRARSPEQILADIDHVVNQSDNLSDSLRELAPFDEMNIEVGADRLYNLP